MSNLNPAVNSMSVKEMDRTIYDILTDNGMDEDVAEKTLSNMSLNDKKRYLSDAFNALDEEKEDEEINADLRDMAFDDTLP